MDEVLDLLQGLGAIEQHLRKREVVRKLHDIVWNDDVQSALRVVDISDLQDLHVVANHISRHLKWRDVNDVHVGVPQRKDAAQLRVLSLEELLHRYPLELFNRE